MNPPLIAFAVLVVGLAIQKPGGISDKPRTTAEAVVTETATPTPAPEPLPKELSSSESATVESLRRDNAALRQQLQAAAGAVRVEKAIPVEKTVEVPANGFSGPLSKSGDSGLETDGDSASDKLSYTVSSTGKRHNSDCRYYGKGRRSGPTEGIACKVCGG